MTNRTKRMKARRRILQDNERVLAREIERKRRMKVHEIRLSEQNRGSPSYRQYKNQRLGKMGAASKGKVVVKHGQPV